MDVRRCVGLSVACGAVVLLLAPAVRGEEQNCLDCHGSKNAADMDARYVVDEKGWADSVHMGAGLDCLACHEGKDEFPHEGGAPTLCGDCHEDAGKDVARSIHAGKNGNHTATDHVVCGACHGIHDIRASDDPKSKTYIRNITNTCGTCHGDTAIVGPRGLTTAPFESFRQSVHGTTSQNPERIAVCTSCHGTHLIFTATPAESTIHPFQIAQTCGQCHPTEQLQYSGSVHGTAFVRGITMAPTCTNCHGIHTIKHVPGEEASPTEQRLVRSTCVACHSSEALMGDGGPAPARVTSYQASYHGLAHKRGTAAVADCASCHGVHAIYRSHDPRSTVAPANLENTCGHCHPGASEEFTRNPVHFSAAEDRFDIKLIATVTDVYRLLIVFVIGGMLAHNAIILSHFVRRKLLQEASEPSLARFDRKQMLQHAVLLTTFFVLAVTGFALAYPDIWWSRWLLAVGLTEPVRRWSHRIAAVAMVLAALYHVWWLRTPRGRDELLRMAPRLSDIRDVVQNLAYHLGFRSEAPAMGKYGYPEKLEYWAVVWGTALMSVTGAILWFPVLATSVLPFWSVKLSEVVHLYEAWLATLSILAFHFFYVMGHPATYPMSFSMFTGRMPTEEAEHRHAAWAREQEEGGSKLESEDA